MTQCFIVKGAEYCKANMPVRVIEVTLMLCIPTSQLLFAVQELVHSILSMSEQPSRCARAWLLGRMVQSLRGGVDRFIHVAIETGTVDHINDLGVSFIVWNATQVMARSRG